MVRARDTILTLGGIEACNSFTRIYLAIFGQCSWDDCPAVPPEIVLLPDSFVFNIYKMSSWSRGDRRAALGDLGFEAVLPGARLRRDPRAPHQAAAARARPPHAQGAALAQLFHADRSHAQAARSRRRHAVPEEGPGGLRDVDPRAAGPVRRPRRDLPARSSTPSSRSAASATRSTIRACLAQIHELEKLELEDEETLHVQPCFSPVWDTALVMEALLGRRHAGRRSGDAQGRALAAGQGGQEDRRLQEGLPRGRARRLVLRVRQRVVPRHRRHRRGPHGAARARSSPARPTTSPARARSPAARRGCSRCRTGTAAGARSTRTATTRSSTYIPFADHNAMIDPSCEDITGRALEALHAIGVPADHPAVRRAAAFVESKQFPDGTWYGRWGCNYIYGILPRAAGPAARRRGPARGPLPENRRVDPRAPERGRRLGRAPALLRRPDDQGPGPLDALADGLGARRPVLDRRSRLASARAPRRRVPARPPAL